jgi:signal transduction histidine kinase
MADPVGGLFDADVISALAGGYAPMRLGEATVVALSHAIEDATAVERRGGLLLASFLDAEGWPVCVSRYEHLSTSVTVTVVACSPGELVEAGRTIRVQVPASHQLSYTWFVGFAGSTGSLALAARAVEQPEGRPVADGDRMYDVVLATERAGARDAVRRFARGLDELGAAAVDRGLEARVLPMDEDGPPAPLVTREMIAQIVDAFDRAQRAMAEERAQSLQLAAKERADAARLAAEARRLTEAEALANMGSWEWRPSSRTLTWSVQMYVVWGLAPGTPLRSETVFSRLHPGDVQRVLQMRGAIELVPGTFEHEYRLLDGASVRWIRSRAISRVEDGEIVVSGTDLDITAARETEAALLQAQRTESAGRVARGVVHDIANVLQAVSSAALLLPALVELTDAQLRTLGLLESAVEQASTVLAQVRQLARPTPPSNEPTSLRAVVNSAQPLLERLLDGRGRLELDLLVDDAGALVRSAPGELEQVLLNLVINAADAIASAPPDGGGLVRVRVDREGSGALPDAPSTILLVVSDDGPGVDPVTLPRLFDPFVSTKSGDTNQGLGLATVRRIVERIGGSVAVENLPGAGASFRVAIPAADGPTPT